ncbi:MAG: DNA translocase FtsK 4TM domain-containing protein [Actinomycetota bacterium]|jgi:S-DNA-T family DNA segregation ATPase FtsK/SpoIIIE|nr:DNA translocase FtsK 4TM domain-containing protein [Actinomycetota bacterium]
MATKKTDSKRGGRTSTPKGGKRPEPARLLDDNSRQDIYGILLCTLAIALGLMVLSENTGVFAEFIAGILRKGFGVGAYVIPVVVLLWGVSFFIRVFAISERRVGGGLGLSVAAIISMVALSSPVGDRWDTLVLESHGGYLGESIAWLLSTLVGDTISYVILGAILLIGLVITGMSISGIVEWASTLFVRSSDDSIPIPNRRTRAPKSVPLKDLTDGDTEEIPVIAKSRPVSRTNRQSKSDPEAHRKTVPTPRVVAPKAMEGFELPSMTSLLRSSHSASRNRSTDRELKTIGARIEETLATFDIPAKVVAWIPGPTVTMFEMEIARGIKVNRITALSDDLALALAAPQIRILAPIPGKSLIGIEVPNETRSTVTLGDVFGGRGVGEGGPLTLGIGKDVSGDDILADLATMPHLLIAGSTGTGKSVCVNALLMSIIIRATPAEVRLILVDPKRIELSLYNGVPHLYVPVVTEPKEAASALAWAVSEMESRLKRLQKAGARNIGMYNAMVQDEKAPEGAEEMPYLVIVIDELADLMMVAAKDVEDSICRLAQLARAAGIHLIVATQRPSTDIITGLIKTNITNRIAFAVGSSIDSRVILDQPGAEKLVGLGDMLFSTPALAKPKRIQGAYVSETEIEAVVTHLKEQGEPEYHEEILHLKVAASGGGLASGDADDDPLIWDAADIVLTSGMGSTSLLQRRLKVGYARAGRIMDMLEGKGIVGAPDGSKPRDVLVDIEDLEAIKAFERYDATEDKL